MEACTDPAESASLRALELARRLCTNPSIKEFFAWIRHFPTVGASGKYLINSAGLMNDRRVRLAKTKRCDGGPAGRNKHEYVGTKIH